MLLDAASNVQNNSFEKVERLATARDFDLVISEDRSGALASAANSVTPLTHNDL